jgi:hypothetical protein
LAGRNWSRQGKGANFDDALLASDHCRDLESISIDAVELFAERLRSNERSAVIEIFGPEHKEAR